MKVSELVTILQGLDGDYDVAFRDYSEQESSKAFPAEEVTIKPPQDGKPGKCIIG